MAHQEGSDSSPVAEVLAAAATNTNESTHSSLTGDIMGPPIQLEERGRKKIIEALRSADRHSLLCEFFLRVCVFFVQEATT